MYKIIKVYICKVFLNFKNHITTNLSFLKETKLLIAISGGIDSVILTKLLHQLNFNIRLAHCNFNLRGEEADKDEVFVKNLAKNLNIEVFTTKFDTKKYAEINKLSIQEAARNLRYKWFDELIMQHQFDYVLTAHNLDDNLETFLINFTRGTGLKGLTGIPIQNNKVIRPLLAFSRSEIENYARNNKLKWREDLSNADTKYLRNKFRHQVIPLLKEINPNLLASYKKTLEHLKESEFLVKDAINSRFNSQNPKLKNQKPQKFNIKKLQQTSNPKAYLYELFYNYGFTAWNDILDLLNAQSGKQVFSKTHRLIKDREYLLLCEREERREKREEKPEFSIEEKTKEFKIQNLTLQFKTQLNLQSVIFNPNPQEIRIDKDLLKFPLQVRKWQNGDYFYPLGMTGKKKLSKFFKDEKCSLLEKENIWLLLSDNKIVWIIGKRQDNRFKIIETTTQILEITLL